MSEAYTTMASPLGELLLTAEDGRADGALHARRGRRAAGRAPCATTPRSRTIRRELQEYFAGDRTAFDLPVAPPGTPFQQRVWEELQRIGYGETITYAELAARIGRPTAIRAAGAANGANPVSIVIPCHRVIGSNGSLTGYSGGLAAKRFLLDLERAGA